MEIAGGDQAEAVLAALVQGYASAARMEESNAWRNPKDLIAILREAFDELPDALAAGRDRERPWDGDDPLVDVILGDDPHAIATSLLEALRAGAGGMALAGSVAYAAALRTARFHTSNEFGDWDSALHTFTFANAVHEVLKLAGSPELLRGVFDAAMSVYLDRFLNVPAARIPDGGNGRGDPTAILAELPPLLDRRQQVDAAGALVARYLRSGGDADRLVAALGQAFLREDRNFHTIQTVAAAVRQYQESRSTPRAPHFLVAAARYLAAHAPTSRAQGQTFQIAQRLHRGERVFEEA